jgi:hypothetical protein
MPQRSNQSQSAGLFEGGLQSAWCPSLRIIGWETCRSGGSMLHGQFERGHGALIICIVQNILEEGARISQSNRVCRDMRRLHRLMLHSHPMERAEL